MKPRNPTKAIGADILAFYQSEWGDDWYYEDDGNLSITDDDDKPLLDPEEFYKLSDFGYLAYQGRDSARRDETKSFSSEFWRWKNSQDFELVVVKVPKGQAPLLRAECGNRGWEVSE